MDLSISSSSEREQTLRVSRSVDNDSRETIKHPIVRSQDPPIYEPNPNQRRKRINAIYPQPRQQEQHAQHQHQWNESNHLAVRQAYYGEMPPIVNQGANRNAVRIDSRPSHIEREASEEHIFNSRRIGRARSILPVERHGFPRIGRRLSLPRERFRE